MFETLVEMVYRVSQRAALPPGAGEEEEEEFDPSSFGHGEEMGPLLALETETFDMPNVVYERPKPNSYCTGRS